MATSLNTLKAQAITNALKAVSINIVAAYFIVEDRRAVCEYHFEFGTPVTKVRHYDSVKSSSAYFLQDADTLVTQALADIPVSIPTVLENFARAFAKAEYVSLLIDSDYYLTCDQVETLKHILKENQEALLKATSAVTTQIYVYEHMKQVERDAATAKAREMGDKVNII